jgi:magnesium chelatase family protein
MRIHAPLTTEPYPGLQRIEVASSFSIPSFHLIGLAGPEVAEARERVRAAIQAADFEFPRRRVVVNLSPASLRKRGTGADLAIALGVLSSIRKLTSEPPQENLEGPRSVVAWGELGLDGRIKAAGQLTRGLWAAWEAGSELMIVSTEEAESATQTIELLRQSGEFATAPPRLVGVSHLKEAWISLNTRSKGQDFPSSRTGATSETSPIVAIETLLPAQLARLVGVAASGRHHLLLLGPRGSGKSHALDWLLALQPHQSARILIQQRLIEELAGTSTLKDHPKNYRRVGSQCRPAALLGGCSHSAIRPGEFSLAHGGVLIADELPEWPRDSREALREPLERQRVTITRAEGALELPADFVLAATGNFCGCGGWPSHLGLPSGISPPLCRCACSDRKRYLGRLSGPLLDRIDLCGIVTPEARLLRGRSANLHALQEKAQKARTSALHRWGGLAGELAAENLELLLRENALWRAWIDENCSSLRSRHQILRIALSLCAWDGADAPRGADFLEAQLYRPEGALAGLSVEDSNTARTGEASAPSIRSGKAIR